MPEEFDPAWEYGTVDPEIQYIFDCSGSVCGDMAKMLHDEVCRRGEGVRFGKGNPDFSPDRPWINSAAEKPPAPSLGVTKCGHCGMLFKRESPGQKYCGTECFQKTQRPKERTCIECGRKYSGTRRRCCSEQCALKVRRKGGAATRKIPAPDDLAVVWATGETLPRMERRYGVNEKTLQRWLREAGLRRGRKKAK